MDGFPLWLLSAIAAYVVMIPVLWIIYRRWLRGLERRLQRLTFHACAWHHGSGKTLPDALRLAQLSSGTNVRAKLRTLPQDRATLHAAVGGDLAKASAAYLPGLGPLAIPARGGKKGGTRFALPFDLVPPVRPLLSTRLWPIGDRLPELGESEAETRIKYEDKLRTSLNRNFPNTAIAVAVAGRSRLLFEQYPAPIDAQDALPWPSATGFVFSTLIAVLERKRRIFLGQPVNLSGGFGVEPNASEDALTIRDLLNGTSGFGQPDHRALSLVETCAPLPRGSLGLNELMEQAARSRSSKKPAAQSNPADLIALSYVLLSGYNNRHGQYLSMPRQVLFDPLSMTNSSVTALENGLLNAWGGLWTTPRDLVRLGLLYQGQGSLGEGNHLDPQFADGLFRGKDSATAFQRQCWRNDALKSNGTIAGFAQLEGDALLVGPSADSLLVMLPRARKTVAIRAIGGKLPHKALTQFLLDVLSDD